MSITITKGDALKGPFDEPTILVHCCNDLGLMGSGIAGQIRQKYPHVNKEHVKWAQNPTPKHPFVLGQIQLVKAEPNFVICNLIGQRDIGIKTISGVEVIPCKHESIYEGMLRLREKIELAKNPIKVTSPLLGAGLAGSTIDAIYDIVYDVFGKSDISYTFYAFTDEDFEELQRVHGLYYENY